MPDLKSADIIAGVAAGIAFLSFIVSWLSYATSKRAMLLAQSEFDEKQLSVKAYLIDSFRHLVNGKEYCSFAISYTNLASAARSFSKLELQIEFTDEDDVYGKVFASPDDKEIPPGMDLGYKRLRLPLYLNPKETVSGWVTFLMPLNEYRKYRISGYTVSGKMGDGHETNVECYLIRLIENEEKV